MNLNGNLDGLGDPINLDSATNKKYVDTENIRQDIAINDKASKSYVDAEIAKVHIDTTPLLPRDCSRSMTSDLDMDNNHILSVKNLNDYKVDDAYEVRVRDLGSVVNKEYLNEKFLKVDKNGNYFDLKQNTIKNCEPYYDGLFDDNSLHTYIHLYSKILKRRVWRLTLYYNSPEKIRVKYIKIMYTQRKKEKNLDYLNHDKKEKKINLML